MFLPILGRLHSPVAPPHYRPIIDKTPVAQRVNNVYVFGSVSSLRVRRKMKVERVSEKFAPDSHTNTSLASFAIHATYAHVCNARSLNQLEHVRAERVPLFNEKQ